MQMNKEVLKAYNANQKRCDSWSLYFDKFAGYSGKNEVILKKVLEFFTTPKSKEFLNKKIVHKYIFFSELLKRQKCKLLFFENTSRLLVDMGHSKVLENVGFSFERISGLPFVPGSALKGVVSNWAIWDANGEKAFQTIYNPKTRKNEADIITKRSILENNLLDIFGGNEGDESQGNVNFYGIFPLTMPKLEIDIITPHNGKSINPLHFLTVAVGTTWYVPISLNREFDNIELLDNAEILIEKCLTNYGVGAKTASGYGKFDVVSPDGIQTLTDEFENLANAENAKFERAKREEEKRREKEKREEEAKRREMERLKNLSPEELAMEQFENTLPGHTSVEKAGALKGKMAKIAELSEENQRSICLLLQTKYGFVWQSDLKEAEKAEKQNEKKRAKNKGFKRVNAVKPIAVNLGVNLP